MGTYEYDDVGRLTTVADQAEIGPVGLLSADLTQPTRLLTA